MTTGARNIFAAMKDVTSINWIEITSTLNEKGFCQISGLLTKEECQDLINLYSQPIYRSVINMRRYRFGAGEYKYFSYPLPQPIQSIRESFHPRLAVVANGWSTMLGDGQQYPPDHKEFISTCHGQGQLRSTPLILHYQQGGYNTLHQDLYGDIYFPFQVVIVLSQHGQDFDGGELVMTEQLPRAQSRAHVITPDRGDAIIFTTNFRPVKGTRGYYRSKMKHGVSEIKKGERYAVGVIFHDAN
jgi:hypothetical protein